jgi:tetratricopeptide (TPR) repeat protein
MRSFHSAILLILISCSKPSADNTGEQELRLREAFEKQWGERSEGSDSVRLKLAALPGRNEYILYCRAWKLASEGNRDRALKTADSLVMGFPAFDKGVYLRANLRLENRDTSGSLSDFERCLKKNPLFFECRMNRGSLFFSKGMPDLAFQDFKEALKIKPADAQAMLNMGNAQYALGQPDSACQQWSKAAASGLKEAVEISEKLCLSVK